MRDQEFMECDTCRAKPGSPYLCSGCLHNRALIEKLQNKIEGKHWQVVLEDIVDNGTTHITIPTPDDWKCEREGCRMDYKHTHGTYPTFNAQ